MLSKTFKPMLAPNESVDLSTLKYPLLASYKLDGIRCIFIGGMMLSRTLKPIPNIQLQKRFEHLKMLSARKDIILDGELYSHGYTFQDITSVVMSKDTNPRDIEFHAFDAIDKRHEIFQDRLYAVLTSCDDLYVRTVKQTRVYNALEVEEWMDESLGNGFEGLILKNPNGHYKYGRGTVKEGLIYKVKPYITIDAQIIGVEQATAVNEDADKKINELGRSVTSKKKGDRHLIDKASCFVVRYNDLILNVVIALSDVEKEEIWTNALDYIGKWIEYKAMLVGSKDLPRHPVFIRFRGDL